MAFQKLSSTSSSGLGMSASSSSSSGYPGVQEILCGGDDTLQSSVPTQCLEEAAQAHHADVSEGHTGTGTSHCKSLASATSVASSDSELGCLAESLAQDVEGLQALRAAVAACEASEVFTPADLALVGSGEVLPQDTVALIVGGCQVPGVGKALVDLFLVSRSGLEGTLALQSRRRALKGGGPSPPAPACWVFAPSWGQEQPNR